MKRLLLAMAALVLLASCAPGHGPGWHGWRNGWDCSGPSWHGASGPGRSTW